MNTISATIPDDEQIFSQYQQQQSFNNGIIDKTYTGGGHVMFDPLTNFKDLNDAKMDNHLSQQQYKNITPWRALTEVIAVPVVMMTFIVAVKINILIKIILIFMIVVHIIISTCLVSYLSKNYNSQVRGDGASSGGINNIASANQMNIRTDN